MMIHPAVTLKIGSISLVIILTVIPLLLNASGQSQNDSFMCRYFNVVLKPLGICVPTVEMSPSVEVVDTETEGESVFNQVTYPVTDSAADIFVPTVIYRDVEQRYENKSLTMADVNLAIQNFISTQPFNNSVVFDPTYLEDKIASFDEMRLRQSERDNESSSDRVKELRQSSHSSAANITLGSNYLSGDGDDEGVFVSSTGLVSIGTNADLAHLGVSSGVATTTVMLTNNSDDARILFSNSTFTNFASIGLFNSGLTLSGGSDPTTASHIFINDAGNVGIGTTSPNEKLTVSGNTSIGGTFSAMGTVTFGTLSLGLLQADSSGVLSSVATATLGIALSDTTGILAATRGGTGLSTITENQLLIGGAGNTWSQVATSSLAVLFGLSTSFTNSAQLAALLSDKTGSVGGGLAVFSNGPTFTGLATFASTTNAGTLNVTGLTTLATTTINNVTLNNALAITSGGTGATTSALARTNLGASTVGANIFTLANPGAIRFLQINATNSVSAVATSTLGIALSDTTGTLAVARGGTGFSTTNLNQLLIGGVGDTLLQVATSSLGLSTSFTNSAQLAALLSDKTGSVGGGLAVFSNGPTFTGTLTAATTTLATTTINNVTLNNALAITSGGTGATTSALARTNLGATTVGANIFTLANPGAVRFLQINADNTVLAVASSTLGLASSFSPTFTGVLTAATTTLATTTINNVTLNNALAITSGGTGATTSALARTNLGASTVGANIFTLANPGAVRFLQINATNSVSAVATSTLGLAGLSDLANYLPLTGGSLSGNLILSGTNANIILGSNYVSGDGGDEGLYVTSAGNVGIGTSTPGSLLTVAGAVNSTDLLGGATTLSTDANGNIIRTPSDERLKKNVVTIENALDTVLALRGVRYEWLDTARFGDVTEIGFLAQEVDPLIPEVVRKGGEYWTLNTPNMLAYVVEAIKEMWQTVQGHSERIDVLESQNEQLRERLEALEQGVGQRVPDTSVTESSAAVPENTPSPNSVEENNDVQSEAIGDPIVTQESVPTSETLELAEVTFEVPVTQ